MEPMWRLLGRPYFSLLDFFLVILFFPSPGVSMWVMGAPDMVWQGAVAGVQERWFWG